jgi:hypothetical protein
VHVVLVGIVGGFDSVGGQIMGLTLYWEQRLDDADLVSFFDDNRQAWLTAARDALQYARDRFPDNSTIRRDDIAQFLVISLVTL